MSDADKIRFYLGFIDESTLPTIIIDMLLARHADKEEPLQTYLVVIDCLNWLIARSTATGAIYTSRSESIGDEEIATKGDSELESYKKLLKYIQSNPSYIDPSLDNLGYLIVIGGVSRSDYHKVKADPNGRDWTDETSPYHQNNCPIDFNY